MEKLFWPKYLKRKNIVEIIKKFSKLPMLILVAPTGYGKTTAVHEFIRQYKKPKNIWIEFSEDETDEVWVWGKLCDELKIFDSKLSEQLIQLGLPKTKQEIMFFLKILQVKIKDEFFLILDDYQEFNNIFLNKLLETLAYKKIHNLHIIIISRVYPEMPYEEMWIKGCCFLIEQGSFIADKEEINRFFQINDVNLSEEDLDNIYSCTEGWMAAVYLALMDYKKSGVFRSLGSVSHLMKMSIYDKLPDSIKELLMKMSLFNSFTCEQASFISGIDLSPEALYDCLEKVGFVKYDYLTKKYQIHTLFKAVARIELENSIFDKNELYNKCAQLYEMEQKYINSINYYTKAKNIDAIFELMKHVQCYTLYEQAPTIIKFFFDSIPLEDKLKHYKQYFSYISALVTNDNTHEGIKLFNEAKNYFSDAYNEPDKDNILGELYIIESFLKFNNLELMTECCKKAYELIDTKNSKIFNENMVLTFGVPEIITLYHYKEGKLKQVIDSKKEYTYYYMRLIKGVEGSWDQLFEAEYYYTTGNIEKAQVLAEIMCEKSKFRKQLCITISSYFLLMRCDIYFGRKEMFNKRMDELRQSVKNESQPALIMDYDIAIGYLYSIIGRTDKVAEWIYELKLDECNFAVRCTRYGCIVYGFILKETKQWVKLSALAEEMFIPFSKTRHIYVMIYSLIYSAIASYHLNGVESSCDYLVKAANIAKQDKIIMPFVEFTLDLMPIYKELAREEDYFKTIIKYGTEYKKGIEKFIDKNENINLTEREKELIVLVKNGYKNSEISDKLGIAIVTVEKTLTGIYRKLNVKNRIAAVSKIKEEHII